MKRESDRKCINHAHVHASAKSFDRCELDERFLNSSLCLSQYVFFFKTRKGLNPMLTGKQFNKTRGLEALTRMLFFTFSVIIIGFCVKSEVQ